MQARLSQWIQFGQRAKIFLAKGPRYHYTYGRWRLDGWWRKKRACRFDIDDETFFTQLELKNHDLADVERAAAEKDYERAWSRLTTYFRTRQQPQFYFSWKDRDKIISIIGDEQQQATIYHADQVCQNVFSFRQVAPIRFENEIDWAYCPGGNTDWTWDLNRHTYFITLGKAYWYTGDEKYAVKFTELILDWIDKNPARVGRQNWDSVLEVALRINTWLWAYYFFRQADAFEPVVFLKSLLTHGRYLAARIERHVVNNHLLSEAKALAFCGLLFPEFKEAREWQASGLRTLWNEVEKQVCADGVHAERAPLYHRCVMSELLEILAFLDHNDLHVPQHVIDRFENMLDFEMNITKPDGTIPLFSDSALTDVTVRFSARGGGATLFDKVKLAGRGLDEDMAWLLGGWALGQNRMQAETNSSPASRPFVHGGYFVMRAGQKEQELYLAFDCGPFGYRRLPNHGHADALSFELYAYGHSLLLDSGVYSYHVGKEWRNYFRGTRAHNTVVVDGKDQSVLLGARHVYRPARATLHQWASSQQFDFVDGSHDGYRRLRQPITHRRQIFFVKPEYWIVTDWLTGRGQHQFDLLFHLPPGSDPQMSESDGLTLETGTTTGLIIAPSFPLGPQTVVTCGVTNPIQGWVSFYSGEKLPAPVVSYTMTATVPIGFCTILYPYRANVAPTINVAPLTIRANDKMLSHTDAIGVRIESEQYVDYWVTDRRPNGGFKTFANYKTDSRLLYLRTLSTNPSHAVMLNGRRVMANGTPLIDKSELVDRLEWKIR